jgi:prepilin-type N-terminal cleavage/methylation domain-containing protein
MTRLRATDGYTMLELLLALTILVMLVAVLYPSITRARTASIETSTVASLRTIVTGQATYAATCGGGYYAPSMTWLSRAGANGREGFINAEFDANIVDRLGYRIRFTAGAPATVSPATCNGLTAGGAVQDYFVSADPLDTTGAASLGRHFGSNSSGIVYLSSKRVRPVFKGSPAAPAAPLR